MAQTGAFLSTGAFPPPGTRLQKEARRVFGALLLFFVVWLLLALLVITLLATVISAGILLVTNIPGFFVLLAGVGLVAGALAVLWALITPRRRVPVQWVELSLYAQPKLTGLLSELKLPFPVRLYCSPGTTIDIQSTSVLSSLFFPRRYTLIIGLGLVNGLSVAELQATLAHTVGSLAYPGHRWLARVYMSNKMVYQQLFQNNIEVNRGGYWSVWQATWAFFERVASRMQTIVQRLLRQVYQVLHCNREAFLTAMVFHADQVAAALYGKIYVQALHRQQLAQVCWVMVRERADDWLGVNYIIKDLYMPHQWVMQETTHEQQSAAAATSFGAPKKSWSRVISHDQWMSHPLLETRVTRLQPVASPANKDERSAWALFDEAEALKEELTNVVYDSTSYPQASVLAPERFIKVWQDERAVYGLPALYKGFYDDREWQFDNIDGGLFIPDNELEPLQPWSQPAYATLPGSVGQLKQDIQLLEAIRKAQKPLPTFDFDGERYKAAEAGTLLQKLKAELAVKLGQLEEMDRAGVRFFYSQALRQSTATAAELMRLYTDYFNTHTTVRTVVERIEKMRHNLGPLYGEVEAGAAGRVIQHLKEVDEPAFKEALRYLYIRNLIEEAPGLEERIRQFLEATYTYFDGSDFFQHELAELEAVSRFTVKQVQRAMFRRFKNLLVFQAALVEQQ